MSFRVPALVIVAIVQKPLCVVQPLFDLILFLGASWAMDICRKLLPILLFLMFSWQLAAEPTVGESILALRGVGTMPVSSPIGTLEDPSRPTHPAISAAYAALTDVYRPNWFEIHVHPEFVEALNRLHDKRLAQTLPTTAVLGMAKVYPTHVYVQAMVDRGGEGWEVWDLILTEDSFGIWRLVSLTIP